MEKYEKSELEVIELNGENVIVTSCTPADVPAYDDWLG